MSPVLLSGPAVEPVTLPDAKLYLRIDDAAEDQLIGTLITAARLLVEAASGRLLIEQTWRITLDAWPFGARLCLPLSPVNAIAAARVFDAANGSQPVAAGVLALEPGADPPVIALNSPPPQPGRPRAGVEIDVVAGFGPAPSDVPAPLRQAVLMLVARWFENRGDGAAGADASLPADVAALVQPYRRARL
jgi:uncharacterized phiE125 gp8 family phage protein